MVIIMKQKNWILLSILFVIIIGGGIFFFVSNNNSNNIEISNSTNTYDANKTSSTNTVENKDVKPPEENTQTPDSTEKPEEKTEPKEQKPQAQPEEKQLSTFTTKIYSTDSARQNNINITCNTLNGTIVKKGDSFSFTKTVGQASSSKGYEEADIYDNDGNKKKGLGGGNCQLSSTLYNALLACPSLVVTERHAHSNYVPYVKKGKDAAVAYGSYDLKFKNNSESDIKILCSTDGKSVTVTLNSIQ